MRTHHHPRLGHRIIIALATAVLAGLLAGCRVTSNFQAAPFSLILTPASMTAIEGQRCVFLVQLADDSGTGPVTLTAIAPELGATVEPPVLTPGAVAEITLVPAAGSAGTTLSAEIYGERGGVTDAVEASINVVDGTDESAEAAAQIRDRFIAYLQAQYPALGITDQTIWTGTPVNPELMIVAHYLYFSAEWEIGLSWHVMIEPHDWAGIYLRHRFMQARPSAAFKISSLADPDEAPHTEDPPPALYR